jgi:hypothetical protein
MRMTSAPGMRRVVGPSGVEWRVGRRWFAIRKPRLVLGRGADAVEGGLNFSWWIMPCDFGSVADLEGYLIAIVAVVAALLIVVPVLLFGIELIALGIVLAATT